MEQSAVKRRDFLLATAMTGAAAAIGNAAQNGAAKSTTIDKAFLENLVGTFADTSALNKVSQRDAIDESLVGMRMFERPLVSIGSADDPWFKDMQQEGVIGPHFMLPAAWLPGAVSVISVFSPFMERVRKANQVTKEWPCREWLHGRIEGHRFIEAMAAYIRDTIIVAGGGRAIAPMLDPRFAYGGVVAEKDLEALIGPVSATNIPNFNSNWSERHVAYICGIGSFGRHTCIISRKGTAGRLTSVITDLKIEPDTRAYSDRFGFCSKCGTCERRCPAAAITATGKDIKTCATNLGKQMRLKYTIPRYGCGKCQTAIPCETRAFNI